MSKLATRTRVKTRLTELERTIESQSPDSFVAIGAALGEIRHHRLYKETGGSFSAYCKRRWGLSAAHVNRKIAAADVIVNLNEIDVDPPRVEQHAYLLSRLPPEKQSTTWRNVFSSAKNGQISSAHVRKVVDKSLQVLRMQSSESVEWFTPSEYVEAARKVMGEIDLDPASCAAANRTVRAKRFFTSKQDGLRRTWRGRVFLNPPYGRTGRRSNQAAWSQHLLEQYNAGHIVQAVLIVTASIGDSWFPPLWEYSICFPHKRIRFLSAGDSIVQQPTKGNALVYLGRRHIRFVDVFSALGQCVVPGIRSCISLH